MSGRFWRTAEEIIEEAMKRGEFDNLPGKGKPLKLDDDPNVPVGQRAAYGILKRGGLVPEEVTMLKQLYALRRQLSEDASLSDAQKTELKKKIRDLEVTVRSRIENFNRQARLDRS